MFLVFKVREIDSVRIQSDGKKLRPRDTGSRGQGPETLFSLHHSVRGKGSGAAPVECWPPVTCVTPPLCPPSFSVPLASWQLSLLEDTWIWVTNHSLPTVSDNLELASAVLKWGNVT